MLKRGLLTLGIISFLVGCGSSDSSTKPGNSDNNDTNDSHKKSSSFSIKINSKKSSYTTDENVTLQAVITGDIGANPTYVWKEGGLVLGHDKVLKREFNASLHSVSLNVSDLGVNKSATYDFNVSDFTNFENKKLTARNDEVLVQKDKNLMWVSDKNSSKHACLAVHHDKQSEKDASRAFCSNLRFAGYGDWRTPTVAELQSFIKETVNANILPAYYAPCKVLIATDNGNVNIFRAIVTRYGAKAGFGKLGDINATVKDQNDGFSFTTNIGLRCVRNVNLVNQSQNKPPIANAGPDQTVRSGSTITFDGSKSSDPDGHIVKYEWIYNGSVLNSNTSVPTYTRGVTKSAGETALVTLKVTDDKGATSTDSMLVTIN